MPKQAAPKPAPAPRGRSLLARDAWGGLGMDWRRIRHPYLLWHRCPPLFEENGTPLPPEKRAAMLREIRRHVMLPPAEALAELARRTRASAQSLARRGACVIEIEAKQTGPMPVTHHPIFGTPYIDGRRIKRAVPSAATALEAHPAEGTGALVDLDPDTGGLVTPSGRAWSFVISAEGPNVNQADAALEKALTSGSLGQFRVSSKTRREPLRAGEPLPDDLPPKARLILEEIGDLDPTELVQAKNLLQRARQQVEPVHLPNLCRKVAEHYAKAGPDAKRAVEEYCRERLGVSLPSGS